MSTSSRAGAASRSAAAWRCTGSGWSRRRPSPAGTPAPVSSTPTSPSRAWPLTAGTPPRSGSPSRPTAAHGARGDLPGAHAARGARRRRAAAAGLHRLVVPARLPAHQVREVGVARRPSVFVRPRILRAGGISWQTTTTWKASTDPDFIAKMRDPRPLRPPTRRRPGRLRRRVRAVEPAAPQGQGLATTRKPRRLRATYHRYDGVMHMLAALDLTTGQLFYRIRHRKRSIEFLDLLKALRRRPVLALRDDAARSASDSGAASAPE